MLLPVMMLLALTPQEERVVRTIDASRDADIALLERLVNINSGTLNAAGVRQVADVLKPEFERLGFRVRFSMMDEVQRGPHLIAERKGTHGKRVLLIGHMDTVFEPASPFQKFTRAGSGASGPGVNDMKGGLVVMLSVLRALHAAGALEGSSITVVLTGDEEKPGMPISVSRKDLVEAGKKSDAALCFEGTARREGRDYTTVSRRGSTGWTLRVNAHSGHSSQIFSERMGSGAIFEMARILDAFGRELQEPMLTYSPGLVLGGSSVQLSPGGESGTASGKDNIVPEIAVAKGDIRAFSAEQLARTKEKMRAIVARHLPGAGAEITFEDFYPPMAPTAGNRALAARLNVVNRALGEPEQPELDPMGRGAGDIAFVSEFVDSLSGLGMSGGGSHAPGETADLDRLPVYAKRAALLVYGLTH